MSGERIDLRVTVFMDERDVTPWVKDVEIEQPQDAVARKFRVTFLGWHHVIIGARWDIFGSTNPADQEQYCLISNGFVPPDEPFTTDIRRGTMPMRSVEGYDYVWRIQQRGPRVPLVFVPGHYNSTSVAAALQGYQGSTARIKICHRINSLERALNKLAKLAGVRPIVTIPDYPFAPTTFSPAETYWGIIKRLAEPFDPFVRYDRYTNTLWIMDSLDWEMDAGSTLELPAEAVAGVTVRPRFQRKPSLVRLRVPLWRI